MINEDFINSNFFVIATIFVVSMSFFTASFWNKECAQRQFMEYVQLIRAVRNSQSPFSMSSRDNNAEDFSLVTSFGWCFYIGWISTLLSSINVFMSIKITSKLKTNSQTNYYLQQTSSV